jgi:hypothetical protein
LHLRVDVFTKVGDEVLNNIESPGVVLTKEVCHALHGGEVTFDGEGDSCAVGVLGYLMNALNDSSWVLCNIGAKLAIDFACHEVPCCFESNFFQRVCVILEDGIGGVLRFVRGKEHKWFVKAPGVSRSQIAPNAT